MTIATTPKKNIPEPTTLDTKSLEKFLKSCAQNSQIKRWNEFRKKHISVNFDLNNSNLSGLNLNGIDLSSTQLQFANFSESSLFKAKFTLCSLDGANFSDVDLSEASFSNCKLKLANFSKSNMILIKFENSDLSGVVLHGSDLSASSFKSVSLIGAEFKNTKLQGARFVDSDLKTAHLIGVNFHDFFYENISLVGADLSESDLSGLDWSNFDLQSTIFKNANLKNISLENLDLRGIVFDGANLIGANLSGANISEASFKSAKLKGIDLTDAIAKGSDFTKASMENAYCKGGDFSGSVFAEAILENSDFRVANLSNTIMLGADTTDIVITGARLTGMDISLVKVPKIDSMAATQDKALNEVKEILDDISINQDNSDDKIEFNKNTLKVKPLDIKKAKKIEPIKIKQSVVKKIDKKETPPQEKQQKVKIIKKEPIKKELAKKEPIKIEIKPVKVQKVVKEEPNVKDSSLDFSLKLQTTTLEQVINTAYELDEFTSKEDVSKMLKNISYVIEYKNSSLDGKFTEPFLQMARAYQESTYRTYLGFIGKQEELFRLTKYEKEAFRLLFEVKENRIIISLSDNISHFIDEIYDTYENNKAINTIFSVFIISGYLSIKETRDYIISMPKSKVKDILNEQLQRYKLSPSKNEKLKALLSPLQHNDNIVLQTGTSIYTFKDYIALKNHSTRKEHLSIEGEFLVDGASGLSTNMPTFYLLNDGVVYDITLKNSDKDKSKARVLLKRLQKNIFTTVNIEKVDDKIVNKYIGEIEIW